MTTTRTWIVAAAFALALLAPDVVQAQAPVTPTPGSATPTPTPTPTATPLAGFTTLERLRNMTYPSEYSPSKQVALVDGKAEWNEPPLRGNVVFVSAQFGRDFAAVTLGSSTGGSGSFTSLHLVTSSAGIPTAGPGVFIGDRTRVESIDIQGDLVRLSLLTQGPTDPQCCPTQRETRSYLREGNGVRLASTAITQPGSGPLTPPTTGAVTPPKTGSLGSAEARTADAVVTTLALVTALVVGTARRATRVARR